MNYTEEEVQETVSQMYSGEISIAEAWDVFDNFDGDIFEFM
jgi:hypothetical protein